MKKGLVIFAATSMMAAGVSLAANVSLGQKMATMFANAFEFVGPVSGLVHALVKPKDEQKAPVIPSFQDQLSTPKPAPEAPAPMKGSRLQLDNRVSVAANTPDAAAPQETRRTLEEQARIPATAASALSTQSMVQEGSVAKAIVDSGDGAALASLGHDLQNRQPEFAAALPHDVWAHLMNKPALAGEPIKLAMNTEISNKQIEAGTAIANLLAQSAAVAGSTDNTGSGTTASQITSSSLTRTGSTTPMTSGQVPLPGSLGLIVAGLFMLGARFRFNKSKGLN